MGRIEKLGATPGCRACLAFTPNHIPECIARHEEAFGRKKPEPKPVKHPELGLEELLDKVFPPGAEVGYIPSIASNDPLDDVEILESPPADIEILPGS